MRHCQNDRPISNSGATARHSFCRKGATIAPIAALRGASKMILQHSLKLAVGAAVALVSFVSVMLAGNAIGPARAGEFHCVVCKGPDAIYRCRVQTPGLPSGRPALQYFCVTQVAKDKGHSSCSVQRTTDDNCAGEERIYVMQSPPQSATPPPAIRPDSRTSPAKFPSMLPTTPKHAAEKPGAPAGGEPKTIDELARQSGKQIKKTGDAVGRAVKKSVKTAGRVLSKAAKSAEREAKKVGNTAGKAAKNSWRCVTSLFQNC